jgi:hypothetical protein
MWWRSELSNKYKGGDFPWLYDSSKISGDTDIGIPNGPAEDCTRGLLKAHNPKDKKNSEAQLAS